MRFRDALHRAGRAARANLLPGVLLQCLMLVFLSLYIAHDDTKDFLDTVARVKGEAGYAFAFVSYVFAAAILPEFLRISFFQGFRPGRHNLRSLAISIPAWGLIGVLVDFFYRCQIAWFGSGSDAVTILLKVAVDQFLFSPFIANPLIIGWFTLCAFGFRRAGFHEVFRRGFFLDRVFPVQVAGWCVWIPGVALIYFMPDLLQIPVAALIQCFWVLIFTTLRERSPRETGR